MQVSPFMRKISAGAVSCVLLAGALLTAGHAQQTPPSWPSTLNNPLQNCKSSMTICATCAVPGAAFGCSKPIPNNWTIGDCVPPGPIAPAAGCTSSAFTCGNGVNCNNNQPYGQTCNRYAICQ